MTRRTIAIIACLLSFGAAAQPAAGDTTELTPIETLDVSRYVGTWYEIAKFPNWFQRKCVADTKAEYSVEPDGSLRVLNRCRLDNGDIDEAIGAAGGAGHVTEAQGALRAVLAVLHPDGVGQLLGRRSRR